MSTLLRLSVPNLAGVLAIALAPLFLAVLHTQPVVSPASVVAASLPDTTKAADASLDSAIQAEPSAAEQIVAIQ